MLTKDIVFHNSRNPYYRSKIGAIKTKENITLSLLIKNQSQTNREVKIRFWIVGEGEKIVDTACVKLENENAELFEGAINAPEEGTLLWYYFIITDEDQTYFYGNNSEELGGMGELYDHTPPSFQITVYEDTKTPEWLYNSIFYQIFPDRFYRTKVKLINKKHAVFHADFENPPLEDRANGLEEFYGGDLAGIEKNLPYLKELGINAIHLTPITMADTSHRYDVKDFKTVDDALGTNEDFARLAQKAKEFGIRIILEGAFSLTSLNSRYFNKGGEYEELGAYQSRKSKYYPWFEFTEFPLKFQERWGGMPRIRERNYDFQDYVINDKDSVLNHWLKLGAAGFRINGTDELSTDFTEKFYKAATEKGAAVIGEVWNDASKQVAYETPRTYLSGREMDGATNYPFRAVVMDFIMGHIDGAAAFRKLAALKENYPKFALYSAMNILGSHDTERIGKIFGDDADTALARQKLAIMWQFTYPGAPSVYYGDEAGVKESRAPFPWGRENKELFNFYKKFVSLRKQNSALVAGDFVPLCGDGDIFAYMRNIDKNEDVFGNAAENARFVVVLNRAREERTAYIDVFDFTAGRFKDILSDKQYEVVRGKLKITLPPFGGMLLQELPVKNKYDHKAGVLLHPTSLPSPYGVGDFGKYAYKFIDILHSAKQSVWQILPLGPVDFFGYSPYQSPSAFAGNPLLIDMEDLVERKLLSEKDIEVEHTLEKHTADFDKAWMFKKERLKKAFEVFKKKPCKDYEEFVEKQGYWLNDFALFQAIKEFYKGEPWVKWSKELRDREKSALAVVCKKLENEINFIKFQQYLFDSQWTKLHKYANEKGIEILGDMPIFISHDSADCWANQELFDLNEDGAPNTVAGVPPDYFSATGQLWGNPQYNWDAMKAEHYAWWKKRFERLYEEVDIVRIDHFRGFESYWEVQGDAKTAINGEWKKGPGKPFFDAIRIALGKLPIVAEDLGIITDEVESLRAACDFPGMQVLHFALNFAGESRYGFVAPENSIVYTGTHDNNTTRGWYERELNSEQQLALLTLLGAETADSKEATKKLVEFAYRSNARMAIIPLQDLLALDSRHRMNIPGTVGMNWKWRVTTAELELLDINWLKNLVEEAGR
ncbi:MAG: 4-alpha-glucanotransferase [Selenomonadaceae bacterium]|nr:4-alpha-glucanotransferase [Selenomonadaceae bacterium]